MEPHELVAGVRGVFDLVAEDYDNVGVSFLGPIADGLVAALAPQSGERTADLGCGPGQVARLLVDAVGPTGAVAALDISPAMVERARARLAGAPGVEVRVADCTDPDLPAASFQVVASSLVLFFLPDPWTALRHWVALLAPGGRIGVSTFGASDPHWQQVESLLRAWMPKLDPRTTGPESPFASDAGMVRLLAEAGASEVENRTLRVEVRFAGVEGWHRFSRSVGQRVAWDRMAAADADQVLREAERLFAPVRDASGEIVVWQDVRYTLGRRR